MLLDLCREALDVIDTQFPRISNCVTPPILTICNGVQVFRYKEQTVLKLSEEWHERQSEKEAADVEFPEEWYAGGTVGDFRIEPVRTSGELSRYAYLLHNCATGYARGIADGGSFFYVVYERDELKAMLEISRAALDQLKGPRNTEVSTELSAAVNSWWKARQRPTDDTAITTGAVAAPLQPLALAS